MPRLANHPEKGWRGSPTIALEATIKGILFWASEKGTFSCLERLGGASQPSPPRKEYLFWAAGPGKHQKRSVSAFSNYESKGLGILNPDEESIHVSIFLEHIISCTYRVVAFGKWTYKLRTPNKLSPMTPERHAQELRAC